ncbi:unnamed protein product [Nippostrongylus brasiliensis]|uniref:Transposase n=1 Tax=Nippostrongylus brasiliensis TaxID=27835 RepID=A0A0N4XQX3_NIPBR|nr:unnamed protein product [Nippostrongylus brasiliensis]
MAIVNRAHPMAVSSSTTTSTLARAHAECSGSATAVELAKIYSHRWSRVNGFAIAIAKKGYLHPVATLSTTNTRSRAEVASGRKKCILITERENARSSGGMGARRPRKTFSAT